MLQSILIEAGGGVGVGVVAAVGGGVAAAAVGAGVGAAEAYAAGGVLETRRVKRILTTNTHCKGLSF